MNYTQTMQCVDLLLQANQVPLLVGHTGIGKTSLAQAVADAKGWKLITIDANLLKEGEIGGLPTVTTTASGQVTTVYALHRVFRLVDEWTQEGQEVLLFIDELNRCEHAVQQELMNVILNREVNGYTLPASVHMVAAMNPEDTYGYQTTVMDEAQKNRFVWLSMEVDPSQWIDWATDAGLEEDIVAFIATFPEYLYAQNEEDIMATPRSFERVSGVYALYRHHPEQWSRDVFLSVLGGNVGHRIAEELLHFVEHRPAPLVTLDDILVGDTIPAEVVAQLKKETPTRLYMIGTRISKDMEQRIRRKEAGHEGYVARLVDLLATYPMDLRLAMMKQLPSMAPHVYARALKNEDFIDMYFAMYREA